MQSSMKKYDFTTVLDRHGRDSLAADVIPFRGVTVEDGFGVIPMWVADMSFPVAPPVMDAIRSRLEMPNFGYFAPSDAYYDAIMSWHAQRKPIEGLSRECIAYENGVLGGLATALSAFTSPGEKILMHVPAYVGFTHTLKALGRPAELSPLVRDAEGIWRMDYEDMDRRLKKEKIHFAIFCSPHNPSGRVWEKWEIEKAMEVYAANHCLVVSDEIWSDIIMPGSRHIATQSVSEDAKSRTIALYSPSKTFSIAGLVGSYHVVFNPYLRDRMKKQAETTHYNEQNVLSMHALIGGYSSEGSAWTDEMIEVIEQNLCEALKVFREIPGIRCMKPQGTYMLFLDCGEYVKAHGITIRTLQERGIRKGVIWQNGEDFLWPDTIRMNFALPFSQAREALDRLKKYVFVD